MLKRLYFDNFKGLVNFQFEPARVNLLVGSNGSGKSTFLEALYVLRGLAVGRSVSSLSQATLPWWDVQRVQTFEMELQGKSQNFIYRIEVRHEKSQGAILRSESLFLHGEPVFSFADGRVKLSAGKDSQPVEFSYQGQTTLLSSGLGDSPLFNDFRKLSASLFFRLDPWTVEDVSLAESTVLSSDGANFVSWVRQLAQLHPKSYSRWLENFTQAAPQYTDLRLIDAGGGKTLVGVPRMQAALDVVIPFRDFSDGEKCLAMLYAIASVREGWAWLSFDEPDNFLSAKEVQPVLQRLVSPPTAGPVPQVFIATHHPDAIDYLAPDATWLFEREPSGFIRVRQFEFNHETGERASESIREALG